jgi:ketosteroid isomerase-like protein
MSNLSAFEAYAAAFEETFADDDWTRLAPYFAADAVYVVDGLSSPCTLQGRDAILRGMRRSLDGFDRKMDRRTIVLDRPLAEDGDRVTLVGCVRYQRASSPPVELRATIVATYVDGRIAHLHDTFQLDRPALLWLRTHAADLDASYA